MDDMILTEQVLDAIKKAEKTEADHISKSYLKKTVHILDRHNKVSDYGLDINEQFLRSEKKLQINYMKMSLALAENKYIALMKAQTYLENKIASQGWNQSTPYLQQTFDNTREELNNVKNDINELKAEIRKEDPSLSNQLRLAFVHAKENAIAAGQKCMSWTVQRLTDISKAGSRLMDNTREGIKATSGRIVDTTKNGIGYLENKVAQMTLHTDRFLTRANLSLEKLHHRILSNLRDGIDRTLINASDRNIARLEQISDKIDNIMANRDDKDAPQMYSNFDIITSRYMKIADREEMKIEEYADNCVESLENGNNEIEDIPKDVFIDEDIDEPIWEMPEYDSPFKYGIGATLANDIVPEEKTPVSDRQWDEFLNRVQSSVAEVAEKHNVPAPEKPDTKDNGPAKLDINDFGKDKGGMIDPNKVISAARAASASTRSNVDRNTDRDTVSRNEENRS